MKYFNYHGKAKNLIINGHCIKYEILESWNHISPALVLYFDNERPMPIREEKWGEYFELLNKYFKQKIEL